MSDDDDKIKVGINVCAYLRDSLVAHGVPYSIAQDAADQLSHELDWADWVTSETGLTFDRGFAPVKGATC